MQHEFFEGLRSIVVDTILPHVPSYRCYLMVLPLLLQAMLLRPRQTDATRFARRALIPLALFLAYDSLWHDFVPREAFRPYNFIRSLLFPVGVARALEYGLVSQNYRWIGLPEASSDEDDVSMIADAKDGPNVPVLSWKTLQFGLSLITSHRGQGWNWGIKGKLIPAPRPRSQFLSHSLWILLRSQILLVLSMSTIQRSLLHNPDNFLDGLGVPYFVGRDLLSQVLLAMTFGTAVWNFLEVGYTVVTIDVFLLYKVLGLLPLPTVIKPGQFDPRLWPPLLRNPLGSDSLADFWTYRWHSILRRTFVIMGYKPARWLTSWAPKGVSQASGVLGAFLFSGLLHEFSLYMGTREMPLDPRLPSIRFFFLQGVGLVGERMYLRLTGRRVGGLFGRIWLLLVLAIPGADLTHSWLSRGMLDYQPTPDTWEWWRWTFPLIAYVPRLSMLHT